MATSDNPHTSHSHEIRPESSAKPTRRAHRRAAEAKHGRPRGETGLITHVGLQVREPGTRTADVHRTMTLFAQEVLPVLRAEAARVEAEPNARERARAASTGSA
jgi:hypothetical protein